VIVVEVFHVYLIVSHQISTYQEESKLVVSVNVAVTSHTHKSADNVPPDFILLLNDLSLKYNLQALKYCHGLSLFITLPFQISLALAFISAQIIDSLKFVEDES